jgi:protoporphyrinogen oxidase
MTKKIAVVGAGPAGLTAAYQLAKADDVEVDVFEAGDSVGGMAKTISLWGQRVDLGPHRFFSSDPRVNRLWLELVEEEYLMVGRLTRIYYQEKFFDYPLSPFNALLGLGVVESIRCGVSFVIGKMFPPKDTGTFEGWVKSRFGARLFGIFFKSYSEKLWGISCKELDSEFAVQRIKKLSLFEAVKTALFPTGRSKHKTLADEFAYPLGGAGFVYERQAEEVRKHGGRLRLNTRVSKVLPGDGDTNPQIFLESGERLEYDHVISTMPITLLVERMNAPDDIVERARLLRFRNTILVYLLLEGENPFPDQWIYVHSSSLKTGRITNFSNWVPSIRNESGNTILCLEYWCYGDESIWKAEDQELIATATDEIYETSLVPRGSIKEGRVIRIPNCYPVYSVGYKENLKPIEDFLSQQKGLTVIGRYGAFKYNNQDHSILMGLLAAENILHGKTHNLWELNTDYEYQESSKITATGLVATE